MTYLRLEFVGPRQTFLIASVDLEGEPPESTVAVRLRELESELEREPYVRAAVLTPATREETEI